MLSRMRASSIVDKAAYKILKYSDHSSITESTIIKY